MRQMQIELEEKQNSLFRTYTYSRRIWKPTWLLSGPHRTSGRKSHLQNPSYLSDMPLSRSTSPLRPQCQACLTHSKTKAISTLSSSGAHEGDHEQGMAAGSLFPPAQATGSSTTTTNSSDTPQKTWTIMRITRWAVWAVCVDCLRT